MELAEKKSKSSASSPKRKKTAVRARDAEPQYVVCIKNEDFPASLEIRKTYYALADPAASKLSMIRVIDEPGEDYLYPKNYFIAVKLPRAVERAVQLAS